MLPNDNSSENTNYRWWMKIIIPCGPGFNVFHPKIFNGFYIFWCRKYSTLFDFALYLIIFIHVIVSFGCCFGGQKVWEEQDLDISISNGYGYVYMQFQPMYTFKFLQLPLENKTNFDGNQQNVESEQFKPMSISIYDAVHTVSISTMTIQNGQPIINNFRSEKTDQER